MNLNKISYAEFTEEIKDALDKELARQMKENGISENLERFKTVKDAFSLALKEAKNVDKEEDDIDDDEEDVDQEDDIDDDDDEDEEDDEEEK